MSSLISHLIFSQISLTHTTVPSSDKVLTHTVLLKGYTNEVVFNSPICEVFLNVDINDCFLLFYENILEFNYNN